ncbi:MAG: hypothetical protein B0D91_02320 [Oceanospirillales bacterium LUC14_002_19_P2]|nr:MAG: hypothetical protein B0D91_02320 [Oceanospirillales bacterium LUC14_002_19_P2]
MTTTDNDAPVLTVADIAHRTGLGRTFIYSEVERGQIEFYDFGTRGRKWIRFSERQLADYVESRRRRRNEQWADAEQNPGSGSKPGMDTVLSTTTRTTSSVSKELGRLLTRKAKRGTSTTA